MNATFACVCAVSIQGGYRIWENATHRSSFCLTRVTGRKWILGISIFSKSPRPISNISSSSYPALVILARVIAVRAHFWNFGVNTGLRIWRVAYIHGRPHIGANGVSLPPGKNGWKIKKRKHAKRAVFWMVGWGGVIRVMTGWSSWWFLL